MATEPNGARSFLATGISWGRVLTALTALGVAGMLAKSYWSDSGLRGGADALVTSNRVAAVAAPYAGRVKSLFVRSGDRVEEGTLIAILETPAISQSLAEFVMRKSQLSGKIASLKSRKKLLKHLSVLAEENAKQTRVMFDAVRKGHEFGFAANRSMQDIMQSRFLAEEKLATVQIESETIDAELAGLQSAFNEVAEAHEDLKRSFADGKLRAPISGIVGGKIALEGESLIQGNNVVNIYGGETHILAYLPDRRLLSNFFQIKEGTAVKVATDGVETIGRIEHLLGYADALPPEFQRPIRARERSQLARISVPDKQAFVIEQTARVTFCMFEDCAGLVETVRKNAPMFVSQARAWLAWSKAEAQKLEANVASDNR